MSVATRHRGLVVLFGAASFIVVVAGLKAASEIILPVMTALFLALLCIPPTRRLEHHGVPWIAAVAIVVVFASLLVLAVVALIGRSITDFQGNIPFYQERLDGMLSGVAVWLDDRGLKVDARNITNSLDSGAILRLVGDTAGGLLTALSNVLLVVLVMIFMLTEARSLAPKLRAALGNPKADLSEFRAAADRINEYLAIKAWLSLATAVLAGGMCYVVGVDFPFLWALVAFLFNFVPNIGSIVAAIPAVLLSLVQFGISGAAGIGLGYLAINMLIGNVLEPRLMGQKLGLSTLVVFLSMLFWGWVWGPLGMLLSVPMTVVVKILLEHSEDSRWIAAMLGSGKDGERRGPAVADSAASSQPMDDAANDPA